MGLRLVQSRLSQATVAERIFYSTFFWHPDAGRVRAVIVRTEQIDRSYLEPINVHTHFITNTVPPGVTERLEQSNVAVDGTVKNTFLSMMLSGLAPMLQIFALWGFFLRGAGGIGAERECKFREHARCLSNG